MCNVSVTCPFSCLVPISLPLVPSVWAIYAASLLRRASRVSVPAKCLPPDTGWIYAARSTVPCIGWLVARLER